MTTLVQMEVLHKKIKTGWITVSGLITPESPIGGPIILLNKVNDICWLMPDGIEVIMTVDEQFEFIQNKLIR